jgi:thioredoxin-like negative regulator of GroEL
VRTVPRDGAAVRTSLTAAAAVPVREGQVDELPALAGELQIRSIPTLVVVRDGEVIGASPGAIGAEQLVAVLDQLAPTPESETALAEGATR